MLVTQFDKFVNRSTQEILGDEIVQENLEPMLSTDIVRSAGGVTGVKGENEVYYRTGNVNLTSADIGALDNDNVYNGLDQTDSGYALDARQGKTLNDAIDNKLDKANVYNGLDKTVEGYALDARQGNTLNDKIFNLPNTLYSSYNVLIDTVQISQTETVYTLYSSRKFSEYSILYITPMIGFYFRPGCMIPCSSFAGNMSGTSFNNTAAGINVEIVIKYVSDTQVSMKYNASSARDVRIYLGALKLEYQE